VESRLSLLSLGLSSISGESSGVIVNDLESNYSRLLPIRNDVFPTFDDDQESAACQIFAAVAGHLDEQKITDIVELGCGTAEILDGLRAKIEAMALHEVSCFGVDSCAEEIAIAKRLRPGCEFFEERAEDFVTARDRISGGIKSSNTLLMCVGHTIPHFQRMELFLDGVARWQPSLIFVDLYDEWDSLMRQLESPSAQPVQKVKRSYRSAEGRLVTHMLTTKQNPDDPDRVLRGIETFCDGKPTSTRFWTTQLRRSSDWFRIEIEKRGYSLDFALSYKGGYGPMRAFLFSRAITAP
jgi:hypothetical protein